MQRAFHYQNSITETGILLSLQKSIGNGRPPVILCIGSDLAVGDSLGPVTGTMLTRLPSAGRGYLYGTLRQPVTAREARYLTPFLRRTHPGAPIIVVDAAVGEERDIGIIKVSDGGTRPGAGTNKFLPKVGDVSILGIVAKKTPFSTALFQLTRLRVVYRMAEIVSRAVDAFCTEQCNYLTNSVS